MDNVTTSGRTTTVRAYNASTSAHRILAGTIVFPEHGYDSIVLDAMRCSDNKRIGSRTVHRPSAGVRARCEPMIVPTDGLYRWASSERGVFSESVEIRRAE